MPTNNILTLPLPHDALAMGAILDESCVIPSVAARDKKHALKMLALLIARATGVSERDAYHALAQRERQGGGGLGGGVCVPHIHLQGMREPRGLCVRFAEPVDFSTGDGQPIDIVFVLMSPMETTPLCLKALAVATRALRSQPLLKAVRSVDGAQAMHALLAATQEARAA